ncbi:MAG: hypothetical protein F7C36_02290 [Desulfurococcales archaeon]|nr:hypothetical protein [Desulfurococcales archaeon]
MILVRVEMLLIALLIVGYLGINFTADLPRFLIGENIFYVVLYTIALIAIYKQFDWAQAYTILVTGFNAGRVSRSIISPRGEVGELAVQHIPLLSLIIIVALLALYLEIRVR